MMSRAAKSTSGGPRVRDPCYRATNKAMAYIRAFFWVLTFFKSQIEKNPFEN